MALFVSLDPELALDADAVLLGLIGCMVVVSAVGFLCALLALRSERPAVAE